jgi:2-polyprenyl-6-methoxyphenol hydroxylase-like FAD-dependent oxidoreductase
VEHVTLVEPRTGVDGGLGGALNLNGGSTLFARHLAVDVARIGRPFKRVVGRVADGSPAGGPVLWDLDVHKLVQESAKGREKLMHEDRVCLFTVMRDQLQKLLCEELLKENATIKRGYSVSTIARDESSGKYRFVHADGSFGDEEFDVCIGADGLKSSVRRYVTGKSSKPRYSGIRVQFAVAGGHRGDPLGDGVSQQWFGDGLYCLRYAADRANAERNLLAVCFRGEALTSENPGYVSGDIREDCGERLLRAGMPADVMNVLDASDRFVDVGVYYHKTLGSWGDAHGRCTLVGDAGACCLSRRPLDFLTVMMLDTYSYSARRKLTWSFCC